MLTVGVEGDDGLGAVLQGVAEAGPQGRSLARVRDLAQDVAPAASAWAAVSSVEPSSTTTTGREARAPSTTVAMRGPSWNPGISARIVSTRQP